MTTHLTEGQYEHMEFKAFGKINKPNKPRKSRTSMLDARIKLLRIAKVPEWEIAIQLLMERSKLSWGWKIEPEQRICIEFADRMRTHTLKGTYRGIWGHIPNEGKRHNIVGAIMRAMGMLAGATDYYFMWDNTGSPFSEHCGVLEAKSPGGAIQPSQKLYAAMCEHFCIPHAYFHSSEEGEAILRLWGAIR